jgi:hypothetical protein
MGCTPWSIGNRLSHAASTGWWRNRDPAAGDDAKRAFDAMMGMKKIDSRRDQGGAARLTFLRINRMSDRQSPPLPKSVSDDGFLFLAPHYS